MKLQIPDKYKNATEVLGIRMPSPGTIIDVDDATGARLKKIGFVPADDAGGDTKDKK